MIRLMPLSGLIALSLLAAPAAAQDRDGVRERDQHYRMSPSRAHQYDNYKPPRVYYPRKERDRMKVTPAKPTVPLSEPKYGTPPKALDRIPKT